MFIFRYSNESKILSRPFSEQPDSSRAIKEILGVAAIMLVILIVIISPFVFMIYKGYKEVKENKEIDDKLTQRVYAIYADTLQRQAQGDLLQLTKPNGVETDNLALTLRDYFVEFDEFEKIPDCKNFAEGNIVTTVPCAAFTGYKNRKVYVGFFIDAKCNRRTANTYYQDGEKIRIYNNTCGYISYGLGEQPNLYIKIPLGKSP